MQTYTIDIRPRRQVTFPQALLKEVGVNVGDKLEAKIDGKQIIIKPKKQVFLDTLKEIQKAFTESGISEKEMQDNLKKIRQQIYEKRYAKNISRQ